MSPQPSGNALNSLAESQRLHHRATDQKLVQLTESIDRLVATVEPATKTQIEATSEMRVSTARLERTVNKMAEIRNGLARLIQTTEAWTDTARTNSDRISVLETR